MISHEICWWDITVVKVMQVRLTHFWVDFWVITINWVNICIEIKIASENVQVVYIHYTCIESQSPRHFILSLLALIGMNWKKLMYSVDPPDYASYRIRQTCRGSVSLPCPIAAQHEFSTLFFVSLGAGSLFKPGFDGKSLSLWPQNLSSVHSWYQRNSQPLPWPTRLNGKAFFSIVPRVCPYPFMAASIQFWVFDNLEASKTTYIEKSILKQQILKMILSAQKLSNVLQWHRHVQITFTQSF